MFIEQVSSQMHLIHGIFIWKAASVCEVYYIIQMLLQLSPIVSPKLSCLI